MDTLNLTLTEQRKNEAELLARLRSRRQPGTLADLFDGLSPRWATEAADRLELDGQVTEDAAGRLHIAV